MGLFGGKEAVGLDVIVDLDGDDERRMLKVNALPLAAGTSWEPGQAAAGFGNPLERDPERVRQDVLDGYVSREGAERDYGYVLQDDLTVDEEATDRLRASA